MLFRQLYHIGSGSYTYLVAGRAGGEALIIDPVLEQVERYLTLLGELELTLAKVLDTHVHADHVSGMGALRDRTKCVTVMGREAPVDVVSMRVRDGDPIEVEGVRLRALHTPGHTSESYSFVMDDRVFTGDTLLIGGPAEPTSRTATRRRSTIRSSGSSSPSPTRPWSTPVTTTRGTRSAPSARSGASTPGSRSRRRTSTPRSWTPSTSPIRR